MTLSDIFKFNHINIYICNFKAKNIIFSTQPVLVICYPIALPLIVKKCINISYIIN